MFQARDPQEHISRALRDGQGQTNDIIGICFEARGAQVRLQGALRCAGEGLSIYVYLQMFFVHLFITLFVHFTVRPRHGRSATYGELSALTVEWNDRGRV